MNFFYGDVSRVMRVGSVLFSTLKVVLIDVLFSIEMIMLANPMTMKMMMQSDMIPPVNVLY